MAGEPRPKSRTAGTPARAWNSTLPRSSKRIAARSDKRIAEENARAEVRRIVRERAGGLCEARDLVPEVKCWGPFDVDEIEARGVHPGAHLDPDLCQLLCRGHHRWKGDHPAEARRLGLTRSTSYDRRRREQQ